MTERQRTIIEGLDWRIHEASYEDGKRCWELEKYSPADEDFTFTVGDKNLVESISEYATDFDPDEHAEMWVRARYEGTDKTIPGIRTLVEDADAIKSMLEELAAALRQTKWEDDRE